MENNSKVLKLFVESEYTEYGTEDLTVIYDDGIHGVVLRL